MPIHVLPEQVASQIAAGEVVERPASVVKELIENAIDAGATVINIEVRAGGRQLIQVADDGSGIPAEEFEVAFMRHATSKVESAADLEAVGTLGFRGEALAAIASVSQVTAVSRTEEQSAGSRLTLEGGQISSQEMVGAPRGTVIAVANLFYNVPARMKFLKSIPTERRVIDDFVTRYALAYPHIRIRLSHDSRITFQSSGNGDLRDALSAVYGPEVTHQLLEIVENASDEAHLQRKDYKESPAGSVNIGGYVSPPSLNWSNRSRATLFVNGRWIRDSSLTYAVVQAYHTLLTTGRYPMAVIFISLPPGQVDVNVHPAKTEVRFRNSSLVFGAVQRAVRQTLLARAPAAAAGHFASFQGPRWDGSMDRQAFTRRDDEPFDAQRELSWPSPDDNGSSGVPQDQDESGVLGGDKLPIMRLVGQVGASYIVTEGPEGLFLIDQHAAHERILYEKFMAAWEQDGGSHAVAAQGLVDSSVVQLSPSDADLLEEQLDLLSRIGFQIEPFGPNSFQIRTVPALLTGLDPARAIGDVLEEVAQGDEPLRKAMESRIILRVCKSAAIKAGQTLSTQEMESMIRQLERCANPRTCPHGRPTLIHLSVSQLAKEFSRT